VEYPLELDSTDPVAGYYDRNTRRFLRFGGSGDLAAIHRQVWAPGVSTPAQAFTYLNQAVADALAVTATSRLLDLGCGVGGTATWLAQRCGAQLVGVTISRVQAQIAAERAARLGLSARSAFLHADFHSLPDLGRFHGVYAIEAFAHAHDARRFFAQAAACLHPGGRLVIADDFLSPHAAATNPSSPSYRWVERFRRGWRLGSLLSMEQVQSLASQSGLRLVSLADLTPHLRPLHPALLALLNAAAGLPLPGMYWQNLRGGAALQVCLRRGWTRYAVAAWERS
jgi:cyclopropane fatty-acyl-phospholipid synthase-like methyltransferase